MRSAAHASLSEALCIDVKSVRVGRRYALPSSLPTTTAIICALIRRCGIWERRYSVVRSVPHRGHFAFGVPEVDMVPESTSSRVPGFHNSYRTGQFGSSSDRIRIATRRPSTLHNHSVLRSGTIVPQFGSEHGTVRAHRYVSG